jgi:MFS family permease
VTSTTAETGAVTTEPPPLRHDRDFMRYWLARVASLAGTAATYVAMPTLMYRLTGSALYTGVLTALESLPYLVFGLFGGAVADRVDRRRMMITADVLNAAVLASVPLAAAFDILTVGHLLAAATLTASLFVFFDAANFGALPTLVGRDRIARANGAVWGASTVLEIVVPALAGVLVAVIHPATLMAADALTYLISARFVSRITRPLSDPARLAAAAAVGRGLLDGLRADIAEGLRFLWRHATIRPMTLIGTAQAVAGGVVVGQLVPYAREALGIGEKDNGLGILFAGWGVGALVASLLMGRAAARFGAARVTLYALPASFACGIAFALAPTFPLAVLALTLWGVAYILIVVNGVTYRQQQTPEHLLSRVNVTGRLLSYGIGYTMGGFAGGVVAWVTDPRGAMAFAAGCVAVAVLIGWLSPLRGAPPPAKPAAAPVPV